MSMWVETMSFGPSGAVAVITAGALGGGDGGVEGAGGGAFSTEVDSKYGSAHRANMMQSDARGYCDVIEMTLVYKAAADLRLP